MKKFNIVNDLKEKIVNELLLSDENELTPSEIEIINICSDIINSILDEKKELNDYNKELIDKLNFLQINYEELLKEKEELKILLKNNKNEY